MANILTVDEKAVIVSSKALMADSSSLQAKTNISPTTSSQTITADDGYDGLSSVQINAMPSGSATTPATTITAIPTITKSGGNIVASVSAGKSVTPNVSAGYVSSGTPGNVNATGSNTVLATNLDANLTAGNIKTGVQIFGVTGNYGGGGGTPITINSLPSWQVTFPTFDLTGTGISSAQDLIGKSLLFVENGSFENGSYGDFYAAVTPDITGSMDFILTGYCHEAMALVFCECMMGSNSFTTELYATDWSNGYIGYLDGWDSATLTVYT